MIKTHNYVPEEKKLHRVPKMKNSRTKYPDIDYNNGIDEVEYLLEDDIEVGVTID